MSISPTVRWLMLAGALAALGGRAAGGITVSPLKQEISVKPGQTERFFLTVFNRARSSQDTAQSVRLEIMDFETGVEGNLVFRPAGSTGARSAANWISISKSRLHLDVDQGDKVECVLKAPHTAAGEYYAAVMVTLEQKGQTQKGMTIGFRIASGVFVTVTGQRFPRQGRIERCEVGWPVGPAAGLAEGQAVRDEHWPRISVFARNTGQARFDAAVRLELLDAHGRVMVRKPLGSQRATMCGGETRRFWAPLDHVLPGGDYRARVCFDYQSPWAKATQVFPLSITPEQAEMLAALERRKHPQVAVPAGPRLRVVPEKVAAELAPGASRLTGLTVRNLSAFAVRCGLRWDEGGGLEEWVALGKESFELGGGQSASLPMVIRMPAGAAGVRRGKLRLHAERDDARDAVEIPVEVIAR